LRESSHFGDPLTATQIKSGALDLLAERVLKLSDEVRNSSSPSVSKILEAIELYLTGNGGENVRSGLKALNSLACTMAPGEENDFAELVPTVLRLIHNRSYDDNAMDALSAIWYVQCVKIG